MDTVSIRILSGVLCVACTQAKSTSVDHLLLDLDSPVILAEDQMPGIATFSTHRILHYLY
jgi:hypothetical protein